MADSEKAKSKDLLSEDTSEEMRERRIDDYVEVGEKRDEIEGSSPSLNPEKAVTEESYLKNKLLSWGLVICVFFAYGYAVAILSSLAFPYVNYNYATAEVDNSILTQMHKTIHSMETVVPDSTRNIMLLLPEKWPHATYKAHFRGLCRINDDSTQVCYYGNNIVDLFAGDIAVQIAEYNALEDVKGFKKEFVASFREAKQDLKLTLRKRRHWMEGDLKARILNNLPSTEQTSEPWQFMFYVTIALMMVCLAILLTHIGSEPSTITHTFGNCVLLGIFTRAKNLWDFGRGWSEIEPFLDSYRPGPHQIVEFTVELLSIGFVITGYVIWSREKERELKNNLKNDKLGYHEQRRASE